MNYTELKSKHRAEMDNFEGIFFAFDDEQFREGMKSIGLKENDKSKIARLIAGGFILKARIPAFKEMLKKHDQELSDLRKNRKKLLDALIYELNNHEYGITGNPEPALNALGLSAKDVPPEILKKARNMAYREECIN